MNTCNERLLFLITFAFKSQCAYSILRNHSFIRSLPAHLKKTGMVLVYCGYEPLPCIMEFVTSF